MKTKPSMSSLVTSIRDRFMLHSLFSLGCVFFCLSHGMASVYVGVRLGTGVQSVQKKTTFPRARLTSGRLSLALSKRVKGFLPSLRKKIDEMTLRAQYGMYGDAAFAGGTDFTPRRVRGGVVLANGGFGVAGRPESLPRAETKLTQLFNQFRDDVLQAVSSEPLGFFVEGTPNVRLTGAPGEGRFIYNSAVFLKNKYYPSFQAKIIENREDSKGTQISPLSFFTPSALHRQLADLFLAPASANIFEAWNNVSDEGTTTEEEISLPETALEEKKRDVHAVVGAVLGVDRSYFRSESARFGSYFGAEIFGEVAGGSTLFRQSPQSDQSVFTGAHQTWTYPQAMPTLRDELKISQRQAWGVTVFGGIALRKGWSLYIPLTWKLGSFAVDFKPDERHSSYTSLPSCLCLGGKEVSLASVEQPPRSVDVPQKVEAFHTWEHMFETGVGVRLVLSERVTLGMRWATGFPTKFTFSTKPFETKALHDANRLGARHSITYQPMTISLEFLLNLRRFHSKSS